MIYRFIPYLKKMVKQKHSKALFSS